jgi:arylsulfatase A-like enzyme
MTWSRNTSARWRLRFWQERQHKEVNRDPADWSAHQFLYDGAIREVDATLNRLHGYLSKRGMAEDTLWWVTSDHGEGLGNHGYFGHGRELHQEQIHVPLIAHWEGGPWAPGRVKTPTHGVDFAPTMRDLFNLGDGPGGFSHAGASLRPLLSGEGDTWPDRALYFQRRRRQPAGPSGSWVSDPKLGWIRYPWKLIYSEEEGSRLYNLADDPYELQDLAGSMQDRVDQMQRAALEAHFQMIAETDPVTDDAFQDEAAEQLRALGYL